MSGSLVKSIRTFSDAHLTPSDWRYLFEYRWDREEDYCGYGLFDGQKVTGFIGLIFSKRVIDQQEERFVAEALEQRCITWTSARPQS